MKRQRLKILDGLESFKDLFDNAYDLIHFLTLEGDLLYVNKTWERLLEYDEGEVQGTSIYDYIVPEDLERYKKYRLGIINGDTSDESVVFSILTKSGKNVILEGSINLRIQDDVPIYTRGIFHNITARVLGENKLKLVNEKLQERTESLNNLLINAPDAVIVIDEQSLITFWNPKAEEIFGWKAKYVIGKSLASKIIPEKYRKAHKAGMHRYLRKGEAHVLNRTIEITAIDKEKREFFISLTISSTKQGGKDYFIAFIRDIDNEKKNEIELEKKRIELEESNHELQQFAHVASHDLKEPVRKIRIFTDMLQQELSSISTETADQYLAIIDKSSERLVRMVDGILRYSTLTGREELLTKVNLNDTLTEVLYDLELMAENTQATVNYPNLPVVEGVSVLLHQLFYNLINNSLKFHHPDRPPIIDIKLNGPTKKLPEEIDKNRNNNHILISLTDNGIGITEDEVDKIFYAFTRLHSRDKYDGTGLGLSLCKRIVEYHKGKIWAESRQEGAAFHILIPLMQT